MSRSLLNLIFLIAGINAIASTGNQDCRDFYTPSALSMKIANGTKSSSVSSDPLLTATQTVFQEIYQTPLIKEVYPTSEKLNLVKSLTEEKFLDKSIANLVDAAKGFWTKKENKDVLLATYLVDKYQNDFVGLMAVDLASPRFLAQAMTDIKLPKILVSSELQERFERLRLKIAKRHIIKMKADLRSTEEAIKNIESDLTSGAIDKEYILNLITQSYRSKGETEIALSEAMRARSAEVYPLEYFRVKGILEVKEHLSQLSMQFRDSIYRKLSLRSDWSMADINFLLSHADSIAQINSVLKAAEVSFSKSRQSESEFRQLSDLVISKYPEYTLKFGSDQQLLRQLDLAIDFQWRQISDTQGRAQFLVQTLKSLATNFDSASTSNSLRSPIFGQREIFFFFDQLLQKFESRPKSFSDSEYTLKELLLSFGNSGHGLDLALGFAQRNRVLLGADLKKLFIEKIDSQLIFHEENKSSIENWTRYRRNIEEAKETDVRLE